MQSQTKFADRIALIEARASGRAPKAPVIAPMVGEDLREIEKKRRRKSGFGRFIVFASVVGLGIGLYSAELIAMLPPEVGSQVVALPGPVGDLVRAQMTPEQIAQLTTAISASEPAEATN